MGCQCSDCKNPECEPNDGENDALRTEVESLREWKHLTQSHGPHEAALATVKQYNKGLGEENDALRTELAKEREQVERFKKCLAINAKCGCNCCRGNIYHYGDLLAPKEGLEA